MDGSQMGQRTKNPPKMRFIKFVKLTGYTYACHDLTNFEYQMRTMTGNGSYVNLFKFVRENFVKSHQVNLFWAGFNFSCSSAPPPFISKVSNFAHDC